MIHPRQPRNFRLIALILAGSLIPPASGLAAPPSAPSAFDVANLTPILAVHAEGAQVYECRSGKGGGLAWTFREPIATMIRDGKTIGRHYAGPTWALDDGGMIKGQTLKSLPGTAPSDIPLLKLAVTDHRGEGLLKGAQVVLRLNTHGGNLQGPCATPGELHAEPYSADYVFLP